MPERDYNWASLSIGASWKPQQARQEDMFSNAYSMVMETAALWSGGSVPPDSGCSGN